MKSKEALENWYNTESPRTKAYEYELHYRIIKKDLELLEILKPMLEVKKGNTWWYLDTKHCFFDTQEHIDLIKEWLENE